MEELKQKILREFDEKFPNSLYDELTFGFPEENDRVKSFLTTALEEIHLQAQRDLKGELRGAIVEKSKDIQAEDGQREFKVGYNTCVDDVLALLADDKTEGL